MKTSKRIISLIIVCLFAMLTIAGCGKDTKYTKYKLCGLSFDLPEEWGIVQDGGHIEAKDLAGAEFMVISNSNVDSGDFDNFAAYSVDTLEGMGVEITSKKKVTYSSHEAYDCEGINAITKSEVRDTIVLGESGAISMVLIVTNEEEYNGKGIYSHIVNSIK